MDSLNMTDMQRKRQENTIYSSSLYDTSLLPKETQNNSSITNEKTKELEQQDTTVQIRFLARSWLDDFEKKVFDGKTVDELLNRESYEQ